jgi:hypothetical protein
MVDVFFFMDKGEAKQDLVALRKGICERYIENRSYRVVEAEDPVRDPTISDYTARVELWHQQRALIYEEMIAQELEEDQCGAFLVWGDHHYTTVPSESLNQIWLVEVLVLISTSSRHCQHSGFGHPPQDHSEWDR